MRSTILEFIEVYCIAPAHTPGAVWEPGLNYAAATLTASTISTEFIISHKWTSGVKRRLKLPRCNPPLSRSVRDPAGNSRGNSFAEGPPRAILLGRLIVKCTRGVSLRPRDLNFSQLKANISCGEKVAREGGSESRLRSSWN